MSTPEIYGAQRVTVGFESKQYDTVTRYSGDEALSREVIKHVFNKALSEMDNENMKDKLRTIKAQPLNLEQCLLAGAFINEDPTISIVPNAINYHAASNTTMICWERSLNIESDEVIGLVSEEVIAALREQNRMEIQLLTISENGARALKNMIEKFQRPAPAPRVVTYRPPVATVQTPLLYTPPKKTRDTCCTIV